MKFKKGSLPLKYVAVIIIMLVSLVVAVWIIGMVREGAGEGLNILGDMGERFIP